MLTCRTPYPADEERLTAARKRYSAVLESSGGEERLVSGSDDFTMFLWSPAKANKPIGTCCVRPASGAGLISEGCLWFQIPHHWQVSLCLFSIDMC